MDRRKQQVAAARGKPDPEHLIYLTTKHLAERYDVSTRTIRRWIKEDFLPLDIDSAMSLKRWDLEELKEFEEDVFIQIAGRT